MSAEQKPERLHKVLAHAGVASRRRCEELIREGRVRVNGKIVREMGVLVDLATDVVLVDDERVRPERMIHLLLYKPKDVLCTTSDQFGRKTIVDLLPEHRGTRLFTVGRLDFESEGLIVVTNDGDFAHAVLHPKRRLPRTYYVKVRGHITAEQITRAREGVWLSDGRTPPMDVRLLRAGREVSTVKCTLVERHHHQLRRIWAKLGLPVLRLVLVRIASVGTEDLKKGLARALTPDEVADLRSGEPGRLEESRVPGASRPSDRRPRPGAKRGFGDPGTRPRPGASRRVGDPGTRSQPGASRRVGDPREEGGMPRGRPPRARPPVEKRGPVGWGSPAERDAAKERRRPPEGGGRRQRGRKSSSASSSGVRFRKRGR